MNKYWICNCGSINDDLDIFCRHCKHSGLITAIAFPQWNSEEELVKWMEMAKKYMGAKVFRDHKPEGREE